MQVGWMPRTQTPVTPEALSISAPKALPSSPTSPPSPPVLPLPRYFECFSMLKVQGCRLQGSGFRSVLSCVKGRKGSSVLACGRCSCEFGSWCFKFQKPLRVVAKVVLGGGGYRVSGVVGFPKPELEPYTLNLSPKTLNPKFLKP